MVDSGASKKQIKSFKDLRVYQNLYKAMLVVMKEILPALPKEERFDLRDQMSRACKAGPALLAEGFAKRYQRRYWHRYLNDVVGECNEMIHHISVCIDVYPSYVDVEKCNDLIKIYDLSCKQTTRLGQVWEDYHKNK